MSRSAWIRGSATFTTVTSSWIMNVATHMTSSVSRRAGDVMKHFLLVWLPTVLTDADQQRGPMTEPRCGGGAASRRTGPLRGVAFRMLGSVTEADDAVQEAWLRLARTDASEVHNLGGWLTTVVSRVCLDQLRSRASRREDLVGLDQPDDYPAARPRG